MPAYPSLGYPYILSIPDQHTNTSLTCTSPYRLYAKDQAYKITASQGSTVVPESIW
jgi:hypothetical protein